MMNQKAKCKTSLWQAYQRCKEKLSRFDENDIEAKLIVSHVLNIGLNDIYVKKDIAVSLRDKRRIEKLTKLRLKGQPLQYVIGKTEFFGYPFYCDKRALIPRDETELLCEKALELLNDSDRVLDLCTGSGCIGITLKKQRPKISVTCSDQSSKALRVAKKNAMLNSINIAFVKSDLFNKIHGTFDLIVSNPPYINLADYKNLDQKVLDYEPKMALLGGDDGLDIIRIIIKQAKTKLKQNGYLLLEIGYDQGTKASELLEKNGYDEIKVFSDYANFDRIVIGRKI
jgi:release factor glutamine methyltransferase